jgi:integrase
MPLKHPVNIIRINNCPKIIAGGIPITPINVVLERRLRLKGASDDGLDVYTRAGRLYVEFCAHLGRSIMDISDTDFSNFKGALTGSNFSNSHGQTVRLVGTRERGERTADLMISVLYSIAKDIEELYMENFDWLRYGPARQRLAESSFSHDMHTRIITSSRAHRIKWIKNKIVGIPDDQFALMIDGARELWGNTIPDGDIAHAEGPESQRGALFYRNVAILFLLRYEGCRRREPTFIEFSDVRRDESKLYLVTKGHGGEYGERLPVLLFPFVDKLIWHYVVRFRPTPSILHKTASQRIFLSHSVRNYGQAISHGTVRKIVDALRSRLDLPWDERVTPHTLRHGFSRDLQKYGGPLSLTVNMRHKSFNSSEPYMAGVEAFSEELLHASEEELKQFLSNLGLLSLLTEEDV